MGAPKDTVKYEEWKRIKSEISRTNPNIIKSQFKTGHIPKNKGKKLSEEHIRKSKEWRKDPIKVEEWEKKIAKGQFKKGHTFSEETRRKISETNKRLFREGKLHIWCEGSKGIVKAWNKGKKGCFSEETIKKMSESHKGQIAWNKNKKIQTNTGRTHFKKGNLSWNKNRKMRTNTGRTHFKKGHIPQKPFEKGKAPVPHKNGCGCFRCTRIMSEEMMKKRKETISKPEFKQKMREKRLGKTYEEIYGTEKANEIKKNLRKNSAKYWLGKHRTEESIMKNKTKHIVWWKNPENRRKILNETMLKRRLNGLFKRPTSVEKQFIDIAQKMNLPYKYTGNGSFIIGFKNPDFVNINGEKICLELRPREMCKIWNKCSSEEYEQKQKEHYLKYGWRCSVIWAHELKNEETLIEKLKQFNESHDDFRNS